jgi:hypothetical protein
MSFPQYNESQAYMFAKLHQEMLQREFHLKARDREQLRTLMAERTAQRQFRLMYRVRHWLHRLAPGLARTML